MEVLGVIPARLHSMRLPSKPLLQIKGKPLIQWVYERAKQAKKLSRLIVATDSSEIMRTVIQFGGEALLTSKKHPSGTDRVAEVARSLTHEIIVNIQGDEPLIRADSIDKLVDLMIKNSEVQIATLITRCHDDELRNPNIVKVVCGRNDFAVYFSRTPVPYFRNGNPNYYKHIGVYGFRRKILLALSNLPKSKLEKIEELEQLRALENNYRIKLIFTPYHTIGVDTPEDLQRVQRVLEEEI